ncbi:hypothetical protein CEXT_532291 [Caerostris extrusa]|uniref:Uncharacterized protein n=1 Tax=Caerostris extrusa TaxID=172846 RepID=A0AAV4SUB2_CAEEX|nr:hypothetical protein CEXT_532291 [Caerostris extrusa]
MRNQLYPTFFRAVLTLNSGNEMKKKKIGQPYLKVCEFEKKMLLPRKCVFFGEHTTGNDHFPHLRASSGVPRTPLDTPSVLLLSQYLWEGRKSLPNRPRLERHRKPELPRALRKRCLSVAQVPYLDRGTSWWRMVSGNARRSMPLIVSSLSGNGINEALPNRAFDQETGLLIVPLLLFSASGHF